MPGKLTSKANTICLLEILKEYSDEENILTMSEIIQKMHSLYGITIERKTVYNCVSLLTELGYEISTYEDNKKGYYLLGREFEASELRFIMDSIFMNSSIPAKQSAELIKKLQKNSLSVHKRKQYKNLVSMNGEHKTPNKSVFFNIECLDEAIARKRKVEFTYQMYDFNKKLVPSKDYRFIINPYGLVAANDFYYLVCNNDRFETGVAHYRVDKIADISVLDKKVKPVPKNFDIYQYTRKSIFMFGGECQRIKILCDNSVLGNVIDKFGASVKIQPVGDDSFTAQFDAYPGGVKFWLLQYLESCKVLEPKSLDAEIIKVLEYNKYVK